jgi:hypothetical protein
VRTIRHYRLKSALLISIVCIFIYGVPRLYAQDDPDSIPLGDLARSLRKKPAASESVIDNDNLSKVMQDADSRRAVGSSSIFSFVAGSSTFRASSPDVTCSLSFSSNSSSLQSDPVLLNELPRTELAKLEGPATIDGDSLQITVHNGSEWELREVLIGLTIVKEREPGETASYFGKAKVVPAVAGTSEPAQDSFQKQADVTLLLHVKGSAAPSATAVFRTALNFALFPDQEWHWAIVKAKGIPPQVSPEMMKEVESTASSAPGSSTDSVPVSPTASEDKKQSSAPTDSPAQPVASTH